MIERVLLTTPALEDFLTTHQAELSQTAPAESCHALDVDALLHPSVRLFAAYLGRELISTGALKMIDGTHEELKSMRTHPDYRGRGVARRMLDFLLEDAWRRGVTRVSLETGSMAFFEPARALYRQAGFRECRPFADYAKDPNSVFMSRELACQAVLAVPA